LGEPALEAVANPSSGVVRERAKGDGAKRRWGEPVFEAVANLSGGGVKEKRLGEGETQSLKQLQTLQVALCEKGRKGDGAKGSRDF